MANFRISNDLGATVFALLTGLSALFFTAWIFQPDNTSPQNNPRLSPLPDGQELEERQISESDDAGSALSEEAGRRAELAEKARLASQQAAELADKNEALKKELAATKSKAVQVNALQSETNALSLQLDESSAANQALQASLMANTAAMNKKILNLEGTLKSLREKNQSLNAKVTAAAASEEEARKLEADLEVLRGNLVEAEKARNGLQTKLTAETTTLKTRIGELEAKLKSLGSEKEDLVKKIADIERQSAASMKAKSASLEKEVGDLKKQLADAKKAAAAEMSAKTDAQKKELDTLQKKLVAAAKACGDEKAKLSTEIARLKAEIAALKTASMPKAAPAGPQLDFPMLVNDPAKLSPAFAGLFQSLNRVKGGPEEREEIYEEIKKGGKNSDIHLVPFDVGSAEISAKEGTILANLLKDTPKSEKFFVVGYASNDGDATSNRKLSSERASKVAQKIVELTGVSAGNVSAVYFGQTTRFNLKDLAPNRVVEVWRVK